MKYKIFTIPTHKLMYESNDELEVKRMAIKLIENDNNLSTYYAIEECDAEISNSKENVKEFPQNTINNLDEFNNDLYDVIKAFKKLINSVN